MGTNGVLKLRADDVIEKAKHEYEKKLVQLGESNPPDFYRNFRD